MKGYLIIEDTILPLIHIKNDYEDVSYTPLRNVLFIFKKIKFA